VVTIVHAGLDVFDVNGRIGVDVMLMGPFWSSAFGLHSGLHDLSSSIRLGLKMACQLSTVLQTDSYDMIHVGRHQLSK
jgi:hypothetical protein